LHQSISRPRSWGKTAAPAAACIEVRSPLPLREIWLLAHADQTDLGRIVAVVSWLENVVMTAIRP
jgi:hypothetical protein